MNPSVFTIPRTERRLLSSRIQNNDYHIFLYCPEDEAPAQGFPVIYMLDGNSAFGSMVEAVRLQTRKPHGLEPAVVVGMGYPTNEPFEANRRFYDYTVPAPASSLPVRPNRQSWPEIGGAHAFLRFIKEELKPMVEKNYSVNCDRQMLFGHSLGGLFALHVLFTEPETFSHYVAGSPSIWWNNRYLLKEAAALPSRLKPGSRDPSLLIAVGEREKVHMVEDAKQLYAVLEKQAEMPAGKAEAAESAESERREARLKPEFRQFAEEGHVSVIHPLISRALRMML